MKKINPQSDLPSLEKGCWYCESSTGEQVFSKEFDTYLHLKCLINQLSENPEDPEARLLKEELEAVILESI
jgi:hypothetical protein